MGTASKTRAILALPESLQDMALAHYVRLTAHRQRKVDSNPWLKAVLTQIACRLATGSLQSHARVAWKIHTRRISATRNRKVAKLLGIPWLLKDRKPEDRDAIRRTARKLPRDQYLAMSPAERKAWYTAETERLRLYQEQWAKQRNLGNQYLTGDWLKAGSDNVRLPRLRIKKT